MKNILYITYFFPPLGGAGVQRNLKHVKYLTRKGWNVHVLTVKGAAYWYKDNHMLDDISKNIKVHRTRFFSLDPLLHLFQKMHLGFLNSYLYKLVFPDLQIGWLLPAIIQAAKLIKEEKIEYVLSSSTPYTVHFVGLYLKYRFPGLKWITDYRDPWSLNVILYSVLGKTRQKTDRFFERFMHKKSDHILTVSGSTRSDLLKMFNLNSNKVSVIPNGFDEEDFTEEILAVAKLNSTSNARMQILYNGSAYADYNPGGFITAFVKKIIPQKPDIQVNFVGQSAEWAQNFLKQFSLEEKDYEYFNFTEYVDHKKSLTILMKNDVLLLTIPNSIPYNLTGKIYEYMRSGKPILATVPLEGDADKVLQPTGTAFVADPDDVDSIAETIRQIYEKWQKNELVVNPNWDAIAEYRRDVIVDKLITIFEHL